MATKFRDALDNRLKDIVMDDALRARILGAAQMKGEPPVKKRLSLALAVALALVLLTAVAFALTRGFGLFDLMSQHKTEEFTVVQPEAYELLKTDLAQARFGDIQVRVTEAVYDGRYLRVVHSTRDLNENAAFNGETIWNGGFRFEAAEKEGVWWNSLDWAVVNGQTVMPLGEAGSSAGAEPGETLAWIQYDLSGLGKPESLEVNLPIRGNKSIEQKELFFTLDARSLPGVYTLAPAPEARFLDYTAKVTEVLVSPIRVYLALELTADAGVSPERVKEILGSWSVSAFLTDREGKLNLRDSGGSSRFLENANYMPDTDFDVGIDDPAKPVTMQVYYEFMTAESYPDTFVLSNGTDLVQIPNKKAASN